MNNFDAAMQQVLRQPRYNTLTGRAIDFRKVLMDIIQRIVRFLQDLFDFELAALPSNTPDIIIRVFIIIGATLPAVIIATCVYRFYKNKRRGRALANDNPALSDLLAHPEAAGRTPAELLLLSRAHAEKGEWRDAIRLHYIMVLFTLSNKKLFQLEKHKTNAQLQGELALSAPTLSPAFAVLVDIFHYAWFGHKTLNAERYHLFTDTADQILHDEPPLTGR